MSYMYEKLYMYMLLMELQHQNMKYKTLHIDILVQRHLII